MQKIEQHYYGSYPTSAVGSSVAKHNVVTEATTMSTSIYKLRFQTNIHNPQPTIIWSLVDFT